MNNQKQVRTTLNEDFESLGLPMEMDDTARIAGIAPLEESVDAEAPSKEVPVVDDNVEPVVAADVATEAADPIDGEFVTDELFTRIEAIDLDLLGEEDVDELMQKLSEKKIPDNDEALLSRAEKIVEGVGKRIRRFKAGKTSKKMSFQCPPGQRATGKGNQCRPSHSVAGGMGNLNKEARSKKRWGRGGKGFISKLGSKRTEKRRGNLRHNESLMSPLALELSQVTEGVSSTQIETVRDEILHRVASIMTFLNEEFCDQSVAEIYEEAINTMVDNYEAGRLEEDVMDSNEFIAELEPVLSLITKSIEKLDSTDMGNE